MRFQLYFTTITAVLGCGDSGTGGAGGAGSGGEAAGGAAAGGEAPAGGSAPAEGCAGLCTQAGFDDGEEMDFGEVIECLCSGTGGEIMQIDCETYCADFGIAPEDSFLSMTTVPNDKCVCDGT
jgi:hypothetical protein